MTMTPFTATTSTSAPAFSPPGASEGVALHRFREAFERHLPEMVVLVADDLTTINIDIPSAVTTVLGALPEIRALRARVVSELVLFDATIFDEIEGYVLATAHAHALYMAAITPPVPLVELNEMATKLREMLLGDASALARRGFVDAKRLTEFKGATGYRQVAFELLGLATLLREGWATIDSKTAIQLAELDQAEKLADQILNAVGMKEQTPSVTEAAKRRQQAFSLFVKVYDQVRRAVSFLRWNEGDVDRIAPSIYAGRTSGRRKEETKSPSTPAPASPAPTGASPAPAGSSPAAPAPAGGVPLMVPVGMGHAAPGLPGSNPFLG